MNKYIIKNCPSCYYIYRDNKYECNWRGSGITRPCQDRTDCVIKQIVELLKETCRKRCTNYCLGKKKYCGYGQILQKLDIQEVE